MSEMVCIVGEIAPYNFEHINHSKRDFPFIKTRRYRFRDPSNNLYIVLVDEFQHDLHIVKFYLGKQASDKLKYNNVSNLGYARKIFHTCIAIAQDLYRQNPNVSFGFVGSPKIEEFMDAKNYDGYKNTTRYRVYFKLASTFFSREIFRHIDDPGYSTYIMINKRKEKENPRVFEDMWNLIMSNYNFAELYPTFSVLNSKKKKKKKKNSSTGGI
jgi:hypothetical protein